LACLRFGLSKLETKGGVNGVRLTRVLGRALGLVDTVVESTFLDLDGAGVIVSVRPKAGAAGRCGHCRRRCQGYDRGSGRRRWRAPDLGQLQCWVEAEAPRVRCSEHGVAVAYVPWARHNARHTRDFEQLVAWFTRNMSKTAVGRFLRTTWRSVGEIVQRVVDDADSAAGDRLAGIRRIGIDEISYRRGHKYLTHVVDHDTGRLLWIAKGRTKKDLAGFFDLLGKERSHQLELISADGAYWISDVVGFRAPQAKLCMDPYHVVAWAAKALDQVRRDVARTARLAGQTALSRGLGKCRFALWKNPEDLTTKQENKLAWIAKTNRQLYRAYLLKEQLRQVFAPGGAERIKLLDAWAAWACRSRLAPFVKLARTIRDYREDIANALTFKLSNARVEAVNTKIRLLTRIAFGFKSPEALMALVMLHLGGYHIPLPGRDPQTTHG
jgi:transposase